MKSLLKALCALTVVSSLAGCNEYIYPDLAYSGPSVVEFKNQYIGRSSTTVPALPTTVISSFNQLTERRVTEAIALDSVLIQLVGPHQGSPITVNFNVEPFPADDGTINGAVENTNYTILGDSRSTTIPANSSFGWIRFNVNDVLTTGALPVRFKITITSVNGAGISANYDEFDYTIIN